jgi:hypothetical protein
MLLLSLLFGCGNECDFFEACDGNTLLVCGESVDQQFNRKINEQPCEAPNAVCVEMTDDQATCAADAEPCTEGDAPRCEGDVLQTCYQALLTYEVSDGSEADNIWMWEGTDCAASGQVCGEAEGVAACVAP